jgi:hypothetical protein
MVSDVIALSGVSVQYVYTQASVIKSAGQFVAYISSTSLANCCLHIVHIAGQFVAYISSTSLVNLLPTSRPHHWPVCCLLRPDHCFLEHARVASRVSAAITSGQLSHAEEAHRSRSVRAACEHNSLLLCNACSVGLLRPKLHLQKCTVFSHGVRLSPLSTAAIVRPAGPRC